jgi:hypothetical protein
VTDPMCGEGCHEPANLRALRALTDRQGAEIERLYRAIVAEQDKHIAAKAREIASLRKTIDSLGQCIRALAGLLERADFPPEVRRAMDSMLLQLACLDLEGMGK